MMNAAQDCQGCLTKGPDWHHSAAFLGVFRLVGGVLVMVGALFKGLFCGELAGP
jgi:hypothetical protein